jgi:hypothetical protein
MECTDKNHNEHICALTAQGKIDLVHSLALNPTVECGNCGAKARAPENVCDPVELPDITWMGDGADQKL